MLLRAAAVVRDPPAKLRLFAWVVVVLGLVAAQYLTFQGRADLGTDWRAPRELIDFRDASWLPTRYLLSGGNPYDAPVYTAAHPMAQELNLYAPVWLVLSVPFALLSWPVAVAAYLVFGAVMLIVLVRLVFRLAAPDYRSLGEPILLMWCLLWGPTRYALQNGGTVLIMLGVVMAVRAISCVGPAPIGFAALPGERALQVLRLKGGELAALGTALALIKPQFGLSLFLVLLGVGWWRSALGAVALLTATSLPALLACVLAAGGPVSFVASLSRNLAFASSPDSPTGLASPQNQRIDYLGLLARSGVTEGQSSLLPLVIALVLLAVAIFVVRSDVPPLLSAVALIVTMLMSVVHQPYDIVPLLLVAVAGTMMLLQPGVATDWVPARASAPLVVAWLLACLPVLHLQSLTLRAGVPRLVGDTVNVAALTISLAVTIAFAWRSRGRSAERARAVGVPSG